MKVTCPISGISYSLTSPIRGHATHPHPMLSASITVPQLAQWYLLDWVAGDLPPLETHLLGCALLMRLPLESIQLPVMTESKLEQWDKFWSGNMELLAELAGKLEGRNKTFKHLPRLTVNGETISHMSDWLKTLHTELRIASNPISEKAKELNRASYKSISSGGQTILLEPEEINGLVLRALKGSLLNNSEVKALPVILSDWALKITEFPEHSKMRWQRIVQTMFHSDFINQLLMSDINAEQCKALEEHLVMNTPDHAVGTSHSSLLMKRLREIIPVMEDLSPAISSRRKHNLDDVSAALFGTEQRPAGSGSGPKQKAPTLAERLAARMTKIKTSVSVGDL